MKDSRTRPHNRDAAPQQASTKKMHYPRHQSRHQERYQPKNHPSAEIASKKKLSARSKARLSGPAPNKPSGRKGAIPDSKQLIVIGHQLKPCVIISESSVTETGISTAVISETQARLEDHELIKVKVRFMDREARQVVIEQLIAATMSKKIHQIGKIILLFKASSQFSAKLSNIERHRQLI